MASAVEGGAEAPVLSEWNDLTVHELREELTGRGLETTGRKADLVARLDASDKELTEKMSTEEAGAGGNGEAGGEGEDSEFVVWNDVDDNDKILGEGEEERATAAAEGGDAVEHYAAEEVEAEESTKEGRSVAKATPAGAGATPSEKEEDPEYGVDVSRDRDQLILTWRHLKITVPFRDEVQKEMRQFGKKQNIIMYPVDVSEIYSEVFRRHIELAINVSMELDETIPGQPAKGYLRLKFGTIAEAEAAMEELKETRKEEGKELKMRHFAENDSEGEVLSHVKKEDAAKRDPLVHRLLFVGNLSSEVTEAALKDHFVGVLRVFLPHKEDSTEHNGYAYLEYATEAEAVEMLGKYQNTELYGQILFVIKSLTQRKETFGLLRDSLRKYWLEQLANLEKTKAKPITRTPREVAEIDSKLLRLKRRIDKDNRIRESLCLPVPDAERFGTTEEDSDKDDKNKDKEATPAGEVDAKKEGRSDRRTPPAQRRRYTPPPQRGRSSGYRGYSGGQGYRGSYVPRGSHSRPDADVLVNQLQELVGVLAHKMPDAHARSDYARPASSYGGGRPAYPDTRDTYRGTSYRSTYRGTGGSRYAGTKRLHEDDYGGERKRRMDDAGDYGRYGGGDRDRGGYSRGGMSYGGGSRRGGSSYRDTY